MNVDPPPQPTSCLSYDADEPKPACTRKPTEAKADNDEGKDWRFNNFPTCRVGLYNHGIDQRAGPVVIPPCPTAPRSNRRCARSTTRSPRRIDVATPPSRSPSSGTEAPTTSPPCSAVTPRPSARDSMTWDTCPMTSAIGCAKRGWTQAVHRRRASSGGELLAGGEGLHRR